MYESCCDIVHLFQVKRRNQLATAHQTTDSAIRGASSLSDVSRSGSASAKHTVRME